MKETDSLLPAFVSFGTKIRIIFECRKNHLKTLTFHFPLPTFNFQFSIIFIVPLPPLKVIINYGRQYPARENIK
ncbi:hypothetical protein D0T51_11085 [Parabacteroides sp. 52]|nr:hypothetical protein [Parabacteroides sp. 52]